ncbi:heme oxygenase 2-like [Ranitomeya variabilis]|uniref:heme oxygenase 2-like n=1 Tax=Ranitomeya variabilis TaxID=490064 RepID=UPI0040568FCE
MASCDSQDQCTRHIVIGHRTRRPTDLSELLKEGTKKSHDDAQNTKFMKDFLKGRIKRELFKLATGAMYYTYSALEEELDRNKENPAIAPLYFPQELQRAEALQKDVTYFYGEDWKDTIQCSEATQAYVDRIRHLGRHKPELLVAHAYTRYMGDLSGGQVLKKVAQRALHLPNTGEGIQFYMFDDVTNAHKFKQLYRARLNTLELNAEVKEDMVEEAKKAFQFNMQLFEELDKIGTTLPDEGQDGGEGKGDIHKYL